MSVVRALWAYAGVLTAAVLYLFGAQVDSRSRVMRFDEIDVGRINVREPDGTLRMTISNAAQAPGIVVRGHDQPHPTRRSAGLLFYNDEGTENGGLIFDGREKDGKASSGGSLTFDRYEQDQMVQVLGSEDGDQRRAGILVADHPEARMDFAEITRISNLPPERRTLEAYAAAHVGTTSRLFIGRDLDRASKLVLRDGAGRARLTLVVDADGTARIEFLDEAGHVTKRVAADGS